MEFLNNIWIALTTQNAQLIDIISIPLTMLELYLTMELFISLLNIDSTKKQKIIYLAITIPLGLLWNFVVPKPYSNIITLISTPIIIMCVFKISIFRALLAEFLPVLCITVLEIIISRIFLVIFNKSYETCASIPIFRLLINGTIYLALFFVTQLSKHFKLNIKIFESIGKQNKILIISNIIVAMIVMFMQGYLIVFYNDRLPSFIAVINILPLIAYFTISIYSIIKAMNLEKAREDLEQEK